MMTSEERIRKILAGLQDGKINATEADAFLRSTENISLNEARAQYERPPPKPAIIALVIIAVLALGYFTTTTGLVVLNTPTGFTVLDTHQTIGPVTSVRITGYLTGEGTANISLNTTNGTYRIATITSDDGSPRTEQPSYQPGDPVMIGHLPDDASLYLDDGTANTPVAVPFPAPSANATLLIITNTSSRLATWRIPIIIGTAPRTTTFTNLCEETCILNATTGTINTSVSETATLTITNITTTTAVNHAPVLTRQFPTIALNSTMTINLNEYFRDPDGDELLYSLGSNELVNASLSTDDTLTLTPLHNGSTELTIYASDLHDLISASIPLNVIALSAAEDTRPTPARETANETTNKTIALNATNLSTADVTVLSNATFATSTTTNDMAHNVSNETDASANDTIANMTCTGSNPNLLPTDCFLMNNSFYPDQDIYWENVDRAKVARFTALGNLLITGDIVEHDNSEPGPRDFTIGSITPDDVYIATIWVDTSGNLHLRGMLHEENSNLVPPQGSYAVRNRRLLYLAYADPGTGDLHLRGNVIPYRRSIT